jgi:acyl carrier protein
MANVPVTRQAPGEILARFAKIVSESLRIDPARVTPESRLDELGAESIDLVEISLEIENTFSIIMPERTILDVGAEVLGDQTLVSDRALTPLGSRLLARRLPDLDSVLFAPGTSVDEVKRLFLRVDVWLRLIEGIIARSPRECDDCGTALVQGLPTEVKCVTCGRVYPLPNGDDLNREWVRSVAEELTADA